MSVVFFHSVLLFPVVSFVSKIFLSFPALPVAELFSLVLDYLVIIYLFFHSDSVEKVFSLAILMNQDVIKMDPKEKDDILISIFFLKMLTHNPQHSHKTMKAERRAA